jgi:hypothetical protein
VVRGGRGATDLRRAIVDDAPSEPRSFRMWLGAPPAIRLSYS